MRSGEIKARLASALNQALDARKLTQRDTAKLLGVTQPKVSYLRNYKLTGSSTGFSVELLMNLLTAVGCDVEIVIRQKPRSRGTGRITVTTSAGGRPTDTAIRYDERGKLDDVAIPNVEMFRMERMDRGRWWIRLYMAEGEDYVFHLESKGSVEAFVERD